MIRFQTSEFVCSTKLEIYLSPREVIFLFPSLTNRRDLKKTKNREVPRDLRRLSSPFIDVSLFVLFFFWRFCNFKTMTSNSCLRCDLKESWLWGRNGPSCGFISNSFFKCLPLDLSLSVLPPLLVLLWLLVCLHFSFPLFLDFLSPDFCCVCILDISSSLKLHFYCSICSLPWPLIKKKKGNQQKLNPRTATSYNVCKIQISSQEGNSSDTLRHLRPKRGPEFHEFHLFDTRHSRTSAWQRSGQSVTEGKYPVLCKLVGCYATTASSADFFFYTENIG